MTNRYKDSLQESETSRITNQLIESNLSYSKRSKRDLNNSISKQSNTTITKKDNREKGRNTNSSNIPKQRSLSFVTFENSSKFLKKYDNYLEPTKNIRINSVKSAKSVKVKDNSNIRLVKQNDVQEKRGRLKSGNSTTKSKTNDSKASIKNKQTPMNLKTNSNSTITKQVKRSTSPSTNSTLNQFKSNLLIQEKHLKLKDNYNNLKNEHRSLIMSNNELSKKLKKAEKKEKMYDKVASDLKKATTIISKLDSDLQQSELIRREQANLIKLLQKEVESLRLNIDNHITNPTSINNEISPETSNYKIDKSESFVNMSYNNPSDHILTVNTTNMKPKKKGNTDTNKTVTIKPSNIIDQSILKKNINRIKEKDTSKPPYSENISLKKNISSLNISTTTSNKYKQKQKKTGLIVNNN